jgi:phosphopantothenoylcysteine decarboxylase/phosphopantothenate--cysteine ligase
MGHALANTAQRLGARVVLITTANQPAASGIEVVAVESAQEMHDAVMARSGSADAVIMAAAVADFRPKAVLDHKLKKVDGVPDLLLEPTPDILAALAGTRHPDQIVVGFAAETAGGAADRLHADATDKLRRKRLDLVVANDVSAPGAGFGHDTNAVTIVAADGDSIQVPLADKTAVANAVLDAVVVRLPPRRATPSNR